MKYISVKFMKRMASYRLEPLAEQSQYRLLLPMSFGPSSITLLHLLDQRLRGQYHRGSDTGIRLHVVSVDTTAVEPELFGSELMDGLKDRFPLHDFLVVRLEDVFKEDHKSALAQGQTSDTSDKSESDEENTTAYQDAFKNFFSSLSSPTSKADVLRILKIRLLVQLAEKNDCKGILWGDTATKLAEKTLAETAKGRGFSLPGQISDGPSAYGIPFHYPLRDLLRKEILLFSDLVTPSLAPLIINQDRQDSVSASSKNNSLDALMGLYFAPVEENFPNIVANVVRTSGRLQANKDTKGSKECSLCGIYQEANNKTKEFAEIEASASTKKFLELLHGIKTSGSFCRGCERALSSTP